LDLIPTDHLLQHPADNLIPAQPDHGADPAHPYVDGNQSASADDSNAHPGKVAHDPPASTARSSPPRRSRQTWIITRSATRKPSSPRTATTTRCSGLPTIRFIRPRSTTTTAHLL